MTFDLNSALGINPGTKTTTQSNSSPKPSKGTGFDLSTALGSTEEEFKASNAPKLAAKSAVATSPETHVFNPLNPQGAENVANITKVPNSKKDISTSVAGNFLSGLFDVPKQLAVGSDFSKEVGKYAAEPVAGLYNAFAKPSEVEKTIEKKTTVADPNIFQKGLNFATIATERFASPVTNPLFSVTKRATESSSDAYYRVNGKIDSKLADNLINVSKQSTPEIETNPKVFLETMLSDKDRITKLQKGIEGYRNNPTKYNQAVSKYNQAVDAYEAKIKAVHGFMAKVNVGEFEDNAKQYEKLPLVGLSQSDFESALNLGAAIGGIFDLLAPTAKNAVLKLSDIAEKTHNVKITHSDLANITSGHEELVAPEKVQAFKKASATSEGKSYVKELKKGYIDLAEKKPTLVSNVFKNAATRPISEIGNIADTFGRDTSVPNTKLLTDGQKPFQGAVSPSAPTIREQLGIPEASGAQSASGPAPLSIRDQLGVPAEAGATIAKPLAPTIRQQLQLEQGNAKPVADLSSAAKNSLENSQVGIKPGALERAKTEIQNGNLPPVKIRTLEDGSTFIEDGRHHLEAAKQLGLTHYPVEDVTSKYSPAETGMTEAERLAQEGSVNPGQALEDIKKTIQEFKDNAANAKSGFRLRTKFVGNVDARTARDNQLFTSLEKTIKDPLEKQAINLYRNFKDRPGELEQYLEGTHPSFDKFVDEYHKNNPNATPTDLKAFKEKAVKNIQKFAKVIKKALNPTATMTQVDNALDTYYTDKLAEGKKLGVLDSSIDPKTYINQSFNVPKKGVVNKLTGGRLGSKFTNAMERSYQDPLEAMANGLTPKTLDVFTLGKVYAKGHAVAAATTEFLQHLKDQQILTSKLEDAPKDWEEVKIGRGKSVYLPKNIADQLKPLLDSGSGKFGKLFENFTAYQSYVKAVEVSLSIFHAKALAITAANDIGPLAAMKALAADQESPAFKSQEVDFIKHGGQTSILGKTIEAYKLANAEELPTRSQMIKDLPVVKQLTQFSDKLTELTFDIAQRNYKVISYSTKKATWMSKHPEATNEEIYNASADIAKEINSVYGGLNWESLGITGTMRAIAKALFFAPDWTYSNVLTAKYAFEGGPAGSAARRFWFSTAIYGIVGTQLISKILTGKFSKRPGYAYLGKDKDGKELYSNLLFVGAGGDLLKLIENVQKDGAVVGSAITIGNKLQAGPRLFMHLATNKNYIGQPITIKGASPLVNTGRAAMQVLQDVAPIPFTGSSIYSLLTDPNKEAGFWDYLGLVTSNTVQHKIPEGMRQIPSGKKKGQLVPDKNVDKPQQSIIDQIKTGKIYAPKKK